jgi:hypothetical protein
VHYKFIAFNCCKVTTIPPFGDLVKRIKIASYRRRLIEERNESDKMQFQKRSYKTSSRFLPILPLVPIKLPTDDKDKSKFITFELKVRAGAAAGTPSYKKSMRTFEEGSPQDWMDVMIGLREIWKQNSVNGPTDRAATIAAILKGDSLTAFDSAMEEARADPDPDEPAPVAMTNEHIETALQAVTAVVFPFRALEVQKQWMLRNMKKPHDLSMRKTAQAVSRLNNYLPSFPNGSQASKFSDSEVIGLLEYAIPQSWRNLMDSLGFVPSEETREKLIVQCERIERNEFEMPERDKNNDNNNNKKNRFTKSEKSHKKSDTNKNGGKRPDRGSGKYYCKECGHNDTHVTDRCFILKRLAREENSSNGNGSKAHAGPKPFSKRTFRKELNALARRAGKHDGLSIFAQALKREQKKESKRTAKKSKRTSSKSTAKAAAKEDSSSSSESESDGSVHIMDMENPIPRKKASATIRVATRQFTRTPKKDIFADLMDTISSDEEIEVMADNKPTAEEKAFLKSIDKEERKLVSKKTNSSGEETD